MRLIDADALLDKQESLYMKGNVLFHGVTACAVENAPTIDPETLPIVRQLREELAKFTAERDAAVGLLKRVNDETGNCYGCKYFDIERRACTDREKKVFCDCGENNMWEWRGLQKEE